MLNKYDQSTYKINTHPAKQITKLIVATQIYKSQTLEYK